MDEISCKELAVKTREVMRAKDTGEYSLWKQYMENLLPAVRWLRRNGHEIFSEEAAYLYLNYLVGRLSRNEIKRSYHNYLRKGIVRMMEVYGCDLPTYSFPKVGSRYQFND